MMKKLLTTAALFLFAAGPILTLGQAYAMMEDNQEHAMSETTGSASLESMKASPSKDADGTIQMNNELCPVSGDKTSPKSVVTHDGVTYQMCCAMCAAKIEKNPGKYTVPKSDILAKIGG